MAEAGYEAVHISEIPDPDREKSPGDPVWHPLRIHFGIQAFGTNANVASEDGGLLIGDHTELDTRHEELYVVTEGHATFTVAGEEVDAPAGTLVYVRDPAVIRGAVARERGTTVLAFGGAPGEAFAVSEWEQEYDADDH